MKACILLILFCICLLYPTFGQRQLTKDEIYKYWTVDTSKTELEANSISVLGFDKELHRQIIEFVDSLRVKNIDSIIAYKVSYPGSNRFDSCTNGLIPTSTYLLWTEAAGCYYKMFRGKCGFAVKKLPDSKLFNFYKDFDSALSKEHFMPIIISAQYLKNGQIQYTTAMTFHEPFYSVSYIMGQTRKKFYFSTGEIENEGSIFHNDNLNLHAYKWWTLIKKEIVP